MWKIIIILYRFTVIIVTNHVFGISLVKIGTQNQRYVELIHGKRDGDHCLIMKTHQRESMEPLLHFRKHRAELYVL